jgi:hypothetical protein
VRGSSEKFLKLAVALTKNTPKSCLVVTEDNLNLEAIPKEIQLLASFVQREGREVKVKEGRIGKTRCMSLIDARLRSPPLLWRQS